MNTSAYDKSLLQALPGKNEVAQGLHHHSKLQYIVSLFIAIFKKNSQIKARKREQGHGFLEYDVID
jgi:hypothetical protein